MTAGMKVYRKVDAMELRLVDLLGYCWVEITVASMDVMMAGSMDQLRDFSKAGELGLMKVVPMVHLRAD